MDVACEIVIDFDDTDKLRNVLKSIEVDNFDFVKSKINGKKLEAKIMATSVSSLLHTLDDYLSCVSVAMKVVDKD
jgi:tRNA threonylcarbamoyladenosine modification (KEOPS) complex  Pcc1 subunit